MGEPVKIVVRYLDGRLVKGHTINFDPNRTTFGLQCLDDSTQGEPAVIRLRDLKAVFFVKDFNGNPDYSERKEFVDPRAGRKLAVRFLDGEVLVGTSLSYDPARDGFFLFPADRYSNNDKVFVVAAAVADVRNLPVTQTTAAVPEPAPVAHSTAPRS